MCVPATLILGVYFYAHTGCIHLLCRQVGGGGEVLCGSIEGSVQKTEVGEGGHLQILPQEKVCETTPPVYMKYFNG